MTLEMAHADARAAGKPLVPVAVWRGLPPVEWLLLLLVPPLAWKAFGIVLVNQDGYVDPWYYLGYGRIFMDLFELVGWSYYAVRFPIMILEGVFAWSEPLVGYTLLRYLLLLACGIPLYLWARREFGRGPALVGYLFLSANPLLPRVLLWDLTTFVSVPAALAGMSLWLMSDSSRARAASGVCFMASIGSHAFTGTAIGTFLAVQAVFRARSGEWRPLLGRDILATGIGATACFAAGCLYYYARVGPFDPWVLVMVTASAAGQGHEYAQAHRTELAAWAAQEYHVYIPLLCVATSGLLLGRRLLQPLAPSGVWWFGLAYTLVFLGYQFIAGRFVLETFYYFAHLTLVVFLLVPVIVGEFTRSLEPRARAWATAAGVTMLLLIPKVHHQAPDLGYRVEVAATHSFAVLGAVLAAGAAFVLLTRPLARRAAGAVAAVALFVALVQLFTFLNPQHRSVFHQRNRARQQAVYLAATQMLVVYGHYASGRTPVMLWYCSDDRSLASLASTVLLHTVNDPWKAICSRSIGEYERLRLAMAPRYVMMLDLEEEGLDVREEGLRAAGVEFERVEEQTIGTDSFRAAVRVVRLAGPAQ